MIPRGDAPLFRVIRQPPIFVSPVVVDVAAHAGPVGDKRRTGGKVPEHVVGPLLGERRDPPDVLHRVQAARHGTFCDMRLGEGLNNVEVGLAELGGEILGAAR